MLRREMACEIPEILGAFGPQRNGFKSVGTCLSIFVVSCFSLSEVRVSNFNTFFFSSAFRHLQKLILIDDKK